MQFRERQPQKPNSLAIRLVLRSTLLLALLTSALPAEAVTTAHVNSCQEIFVQSASPASAPSSGQFEIQRGLGFAYPKNRSRDLQKYSFALLGGEVYAFWSEKIAERLSPNRRRGLTSLFNDILLVIHKEANRKIHWTEISGGFGVAMSEVAHKKILTPEQIERTNVDLVDWASTIHLDEPFQADILKTMSSLPTAEQIRLQDDFNRAQMKKIFGSDAQFRAAAPRFILSTAEAVALPVRQDLITSIEAFQYYPAKLEAVVNLFNQLAPGGTLLISFSLNSRFLANNPQLDDFFSHLKQQGVTVLQTPG